MNKATPPNNLLVIFSHGKESGPQGNKIRALMRVAEHLGAQTLSVNYREHPAGTIHDQDAPGEAERRVAQLCATPLPAHKKLILVGSSMGGYVSMVASLPMQAHGLFLLAPAFYLPGYAVQEPTPNTPLIHIVHGWSDDVVPAQNSIRFAQQHRCDLHLVDGDHRLNDALPKIEPLFELFLKQFLGKCNSPIPASNHQ